MKPYVISGRVPLSAPATTLFYGLLGIIPLAAIYSVVIKYNPFIYFSVLATLLYGALLAVIGSFACKHAKVRAPWFYGLAGACFGALGLWLQWIFWAALTYANGSETALALLTGSVEVWQDFLVQTAHSLHVTVGKFTQSSRGELSVGNHYTAWAIEAFLIFGIASLLGAFGSADEAFNERSGRWAEVDIEGHLSHPSVDDAALTRLIQSHGAEYLLAQSGTVGIPSPDQPVESLFVSCHHEPSDPEFRLVRVRVATHSVKKDGKTKIDTRPLVPLSFISRATYDELVRHLKSAEAQRAEASGAQADARADARSDAATDIHPTEESPPARQA